jgi:ribosomal protein S27AE
MRLIEKEGRCPECGSAWIREKYDGTFWGCGYCHAVWRRR